MGTVTGEVNGGRAPTTPCPRAGSPSGEDGGMRVLVVSYSLTGNNDAIAKGIATELGAGHVRLTEPKPRTTGAIAADMMFNRTPRVEQGLEILGDCDLVVLVGPVWMGHVAAPLRGCLKRLRGLSCRYAFCSISGGADGPNPKLAEDLTKRVGRAPAAVVDLHIADLLPPEPKPTREDTSSYHLSERDVESLTQAMVRGLREDGATGGVGGQTIQGPARPGVDAAVPVRGSY